MSRRETLSLRVMSIVDLPSLFPWLFLRCAIRMYHQPTVDDQQLAGHVAAVVRRQKDHGADTSSGSPLRPSGILRARDVPSMKSGVVVSSTPLTTDMGVTMKPGATALTRML